MIKKVGSQYCLYTKDGSEKLGCHDTREGALKQEAAIEAQKSSETFTVPVEVVRFACPDCADTMDGLSITALKLIDEEISEDSLEEITDKETLCGWLNDRIKGEPLVLAGEVPKGRVLRTKDFLGKLKELLNGKIGADELKSAISKARSHASTRARARNKAAKPKAAYEGYDVPDRPKLEKSHDSVAYNTAEKVGKTCGDCRFYSPWTSYDGVCQLVEGTISDVMMCKLWQAQITIVSRETEMVVLCSGDRKDLESPPANGSEYWRLFHELSTSFMLAEAPDWIPFLPIPGKYESPRYGEISISRERNAGFVENFSNAVYQERIAIDAEHESKLSGAFGWIDEMKLTATGGVDAHVEWTELGKQAMLEERFRYFSPEFYDEWKNPMTGELHKDVAVGGALTTRPFFKEGCLRPIIANERGISISARAGETNNFTALTGPTGGKKMDKDKKKDAATLREKLMGFLGLDGSKKEDEKAIKLMGLLGLDDDDKKTTTEPKPPTTKSMADDPQLLVKQLREDLTESQKQIESLKDSNLKLEQSNRRKQFTDTIAREFSGDKEEHLKFMESVAEKFGVESDEMKHYCELNRSFKAQQKVSSIFAEKGTTEISADGSAEVSFDILVRKVMSDNKDMTYSDAYKKAMSDNQVLYEQYVNESAQKVG